MSSLSDPSTIVGLASLLRESRQFDHPAADVLADLGYMPIERIKSGATAEVWLAVEDATALQVAVKLWNSESQKVAKHFEKMLRREARYLGAFQSKHVPRIIKFVPAGRASVLIEEFVEGQTPVVLLDRDGKPAIANMFCSILDAVAELHGEGVIHRDIKPEHIIFQPDGTPVIVDFGMACDVNGESDFLNGSLFAGGTRSYMAPECLPEKLPQLIPAIDVYALGVMLRELLPYNQDERRILKPIADRACRVDPQHRFADAREMREHLSLAIRSQTKWKKVRRRAVQGTLSLAVVTGIAIGSAIWSAAGQSSGNTVPASKPNYQDVIEALYEGRRSASLADLKRIEGSTRDWLGRHLRLRLTAGQEAAVETTPYPNQLLPAFAEFSDDRYSVVGVDTERWMLLSGKGYTEHGMQHWPPTGFAYDPGTRRYVVCTRDGHIMIWSGEAGEGAVVCRSGLSGLSACFWAGEMICLQGGPNNEVYHWDPASQEITMRFELGGSLRPIRGIQHHAMLSIRVEGGHQVSLVDLRTMQAVQAWDLPGYVISAASHGSRVAMTTAGGNLVVVDLDQPDDEPILISFRELYHGVTWLSEDQLALCNQNVIFARIEGDESLTTIEAAESVHLRFVRDLYYDPEDDVLWLITAEGFQEWHALADSP